MRSKKIFVSALFVSALLVPITGFAETSTDCSAFGSDSVYDPATGGCKGGSLPKPSNQPSVIVNKAPDPGVSTQPTQPTRQTSTSVGNTPAFCNKGVCTYIPLEPLPCPPSAPNCQTGTASFASLLSTIFRLLITFGSLFAVVMLVIAGITYMLSETPWKMQAARERAKAAIWGLVLLVGCWLILYTINPKLLRFDILTEDLKRSSANAANRFGLTPTTAAPTPSSQSINSDLSTCNGRVAPDASGKNVCYPNI